LVYNHVSTSIVGGTTNRDLAEEIAREAGIPVESFPDALDKPVFSRGRVVFGYAGNEFDAIAKEYGDMEWWVSDNGLNIALVPQENRRPAPTFDELVSAVLPRSNELQTVSTAEEPAAKGRLALLRDIDGKFKRVVTLETAARFGGRTRRAIEKAAKKGSLESEGDGPNRRIVVQSLLKYFPTEENAT
jgi:hypothetical protein